MAWIPADRQGCEYTIYTFDAPISPSNPGPWLKQHRLRHRALALRMAKRLYRTGRYCRIEIRRHAFDKRLNRVIDTPFRIFGRWDWRLFSKPF